MNKMHHRAAEVMRGLLVPFGLIVLAQVVSMMANLNSDSLASPLQTFQAGMKAVVNGEVIHPTLQTLGSAIGGLAIGASIGLILGVLLGSFRFVDRLTLVSVEIIRPIPSVALIPVAMLVFGFGYQMEISIVAFSTIWPMMLFTRSAVQGIEIRWLEVARALRFGPMARLRKIIIPAIAPHVFVALRLSMGIALIVAVTVEIAANPMGLGYSMIIAQQSLQPDLMFALLFWIGILGFGLNWLLQRMLARWTRQGPSNGVPL